MKENSLWSAWVAMMVVSILTLDSSLTAAQQPPDTNYRQITKADGLACSFSQDISFSAGSPFSGSAHATANHFQCKDKTGKQKEIELINADPSQNVGVENGKIAIRTKQFGTVYRGNAAGQFDAYFMMASQITTLKEFLGLQPE